MVNNKTSFEIEDGESGEITTLNLTSLVSDVRDLFLSKIRNDKAKTLWSKMSEAQQQTEIDHADNTARSVILAIAHLIASGNNAVIHATLDNFKVKDGSVTVTAKGFADDGAVLALNHVGTKALKIIVVDEDQFDQENRPAEPDPDQFTIFNQTDKTDDDGPSLADAMQAAIDADQGGDKTETKDAETPADPAVEAVTEKADLTPFEQGAGAAERGLMFGANPFRKNSKNWLEWVKGFESDAKTEQPEDIANAENEEDPRIGDHDIEEASLSDEETGLDADESSFLDAMETGNDEPATGEIVEDADVPFAGEDPYQEGMAARAAGDGPDQNPYDGGSDGYTAWAKGYKVADAQLEDLKEAGRQARRDGGGPKKNPWKTGTLESDTWNSGYLEEKLKEGD